MKTVLHYPGSKKRIAPWIIGNMPPHHSYVEPYFGGGAVLFEKEPSAIETVNDIDDEVVNFFRVIKEIGTRNELIRMLDYTPYSREIYDSIFGAAPKDKVEKALYFAIRCMQSHGFRLTEKSGWKKDVTGREASYAVRYWNELPLLLAQMAIRLKNVQIEKRPAIEVIKTFNHENVLIYADPPYVLSTRNRKQYRYEMTDEDHLELLKELKCSKSKVMLSGYDCELYNDILTDWRKLQIPARAQGNAKRVETLWINYEPVTQISFFV